MRAMTSIRPGIKIAREPIVGGVNLDIGAGEAPIEGFIHLDSRQLPGIDQVLDLTQPLPYGDDSVDTIYSSHFLEHVMPGAVPAILVDWCRVLKPQGACEIHLPNLHAIAGQILAGNVEEMLPHLYGAHRHPTDTHKTGFTPLTLRRLLVAAGFTAVLGLDNLIDQYEMSILAVK